MAIEHLSAFLTSVVLRNAKGTLAGVTKFTECFGISRNVAFELGVDFREICYKIRNPACDLGVGLIGLADGLTGRRWRTGGKDNPFCYRFATMLSVSTLV